MDLGSADLEGDEYAFSPSGSNTLEGGRYDFIPSRSNILEGDRYDSIPFGLDIPEGERYDTFPPGFNTHKGDRYNSIPSGSGIPEGESYHLLSPESNILEHNKYDSNPPGASVFERGESGFSSPGIFSNGYNEDHSDLPGLGDLERTGSSINRTGWNTFQDNDHLFGASMDGEDFIPTSFGAPINSRKAYTSPTRDAIFRRHILSHPCSHPGCTKSFALRTTLIRHIASVHKDGQKTPERHLCPIAGCRHSFGKGFSRPYNLRKHVREAHGSYKFEEVVHPSDELAEVVNPSDESEDVVHPSSHLKESTLMPQENPHSIQAPKYGFIQSVSLIFTAVARFCRLKSRPRVAEGYRRLEWICECGDEMWADFNDSNPGIVDELEEELQKLRVNGTTTDESNGISTSQDPILNSLGGSADTISLDPTGQESPNVPPPSSGSLLVEEAQGNQAPVRRGYGNTVPSSSTTVVDDLMPSSSLYQSSIGMSDLNLNNITTGSHLPPSKDYNTQMSAGNPTGCGFPARLETPTYVETCVKYKGYVSRHKEVQVEMCEDDYHFFKRVKDGYLELRGSRWLDLFKPVRIDHVQFSVQKMGEVVGIFDQDKPVYPPPEDVQNGSYHYEPYPCLGVPSNIILHELNSPKSQLHTSHTWSRKLAKKTNSSIFSSTNPYDAAIGYGIHVIEGYKISGFILGILGIFGVLIAGVVTGVWWGKGNPGDVQGATGLGSLILGVVGALILSCQAMVS